MIANNVMTNIKSYFVISFTSFYDEEESVAAGSFLLLFKGIKNKPCTLGIK